ncbi:MAG: hypothetical protein HYY03_06145 [Chloroflexi bacterium]|nr:hypothetical protein [Chloroflexota bacterium]
MDEDPRDSARSLADLAGVPLTRERIAALALALPIVQAGQQALASVQYGEVEPACRFRPPRSAQR